MMMDPLVRAKVAYREADNLDFNPLLGQAETSYAPNALFCNKYDAYKRRQKNSIASVEAEQLKKKMLVMENTIKAIPEAL